MRWGGEGRRGQERAREGGEGKRARERKGLHTDTHTRAHVHAERHRRRHAHTRIACASCTRACDRCYPRCLQAWVVLPHCMQTSAGFWARVGFELGAEVDKKEAKMAVLRSVGDLKGEVDSWSHSLTGPDGSPAARPEGGGDGTLCMCVHES